MRSTVTLLTDFGEQDGYVAAMKGVILSEAPGTWVVDAAHNISPQDVRAGAWVLSQYWECYPLGTIHVAVVDPGVGTDRKALMLEANGRYFVGPDNGLLAWVLERVKDVTAFAIRSHVHRPGPVSSTFHGRDIFAYAAGRFAAGDKLMDLAAPVDQLIRPAWSRVQVDAASITGEVVHIDRFGNLIASITTTHLEGAQPKRISVGDRSVSRLARAYAEVEPGAPLALIGSSGHLEISLCGESAAARWHIDRGTPVRVDVAR